MKVNTENFWKKFKTQKFEMFDVVYNEQKEKLQMVIAEIPICKRQECGMPLMKKSYICADVKQNIWTIELGQDLRCVTINDRNLI